MVYISGINLSDIIYNSDNDMIDIIERGVNENCEFEEGNYFENMFYF